VIAAARNVPISKLIATIDGARQHGNLSSAIRLFVLEHYRTCGTTTGSAERSAQGENLSVASE
jgi:predicted DNA-binding ribbon-helix-helix protein